MHGYNGPPIGSHPPQVKGSGDWFGSHYCFLLTNSQLNLLIKQQILNIKKLTSLHYCVRSTKSHIQKSRNHFT